MIIRQIIRVKNRFEGFDGKLRKGGEIFGIHGAKDGFQKAIQMGQVINCSSIASCQDGRIQIFGVKGPEFGDGHHTSAVAVDKRAV